jgi:hypothetical protein
MVRLPTISSQSKSGAIPRPLTTKNFGQKGAKNAKKFRRQDLGKGPAGLARHIFKVCDNCDPPVRVDSMLSAIGLRKRNRIFARKGQTRTPGLADTYAHARVGSA